MPPVNSKSKAESGIQGREDAPGPAHERAPKRGVSDLALRALKPKEKSYKFSVGDSLYLEVTPKGSKLWRWKYRLDGKENRYSIGDLLTLVEN